MRICKNCGASIEDESMFCTQCGEKVDAVSASAVEECNSGDHADGQTETNAESQTAQAEANAEQTTQTETNQQTSQSQDPNAGARPYGQQGYNNQQPNYNQGYGQPNYNQTGYNQGAAYGGYQQQYYAPVNPYDHTREFTAKDVSDNKVIAMFMYLTSIIGVIVALLAAPDSPYLKFHVRQALKFTVVNTLAVLVGAVLFFTLIIPVIAGIFVAVMWVCKIIMFFSICTGKSVEPYIIRHIGFLR